MTQYVHAKAIKVLYGLDGQGRINILERKDGLYEFRAYVEQYDEYGGCTYWSPTHHSGLYSSALEAELGAYSEVHWLCQPRS